MVVMSEAFVSRSVEETYEWGRNFAQRLAVGDLVALEGDLGAGKTALVRGIARGLGIEDERMVSSPTYVLVQEYHGRLPIYHIDLYRMRHAASELIDLGLGEMLAHGVVLIEWADRAEQALPRPFWRIRLEHVAVCDRRLALERVE
jgi:tRNA threonylcarbamoyladenosine biosynthesis protein TsaE